MTDNQKEFIGSMLETEIEDTIYKFVATHQMYDFNILIRALIAVLVKTNKAAAIASDLECNDEQLITLTRALLNVVCKFADEVNNA